MTTLKAHDASSHGPPLSLLYLKRPRAHTTCDFLLYKKLGALIVARENKKRSSSSDFSLSHRLSSDDSREVKVS